MEPASSLPCNNSHSLVSVQNEANKMHKLLSYFLKIHFNIILQSTLQFSK